VPFTLDVVKKDITVTFFRLDFSLL